MPSLGLRIASGAMAALLAYAALLQINDPDPLQWVYVYGASAGCSVAGALGRPPALVSGVLAALALAWIAVIHVDIPPDVPLLEAEVAREVGGLLIVAVWMLALSGWAWVSRSRSSGSTTT